MYPFGAVSGPVWFHYGNHATCCCYSRTAVSYLGEGVATSCHTLSIHIHIHILIIHYIHTTHAQTVPSQPAKPNQHALTNSYATSPSPTPTCAPSISAVKVTELSPRHPAAMRTACMPGPTVSDRAAPVPAPTPNIMTEQLFAVASSDEEEGEEGAASPQEREREVREKEREWGARAISFGAEAEGARRWVGGGRGDAGFEAGAGEGGEEERGESSRYCISIKNN